MDNQEQMLRIAIKRQEKLEMSEKSKEQRMSPLKEGQFNYRSDSLGTTYLAVPFALIGFYLG